jgi:hypothetical protein
VRALLILLIAAMACLLTFGCGRPYNGFSYDSVSRPLTNSNAMAGVQQFVRSNGWQMQTGNILFVTLGDKMRPLAGIPWKGLTQKQYDAITCDGILYVPLRGFGAESDGIAYNPKTNRFPVTVNGFVPVGAGWYAWKQTMAPPGKQRY